MGEMGEHGEIIVAQQAAIDRPKGTESDIRADILREVQRIMEDPQCAELQYPAERGWKIVQDKADPRYAEGSRTRFATLKVPSMLGKDELCVAIVDNEGATRRRTLGRGIAQAVHGQQSHREIAISRFVQTGSERVTGTGTYTRVVMSDTIDNATGTFVTKGHALRELPKVSAADRAPSFAKRWGDGGAQLAQTDILDASGNHVEANEQDLKDLLVALRKGKFDQSMKQRIIAYEQRQELAQAGVITPAQPPTELPTSSQPPALEGK